MFNDNYLVIAVNPANNETSVPINTKVQVSFAIDMLEDTVSPSTLLLSKVNGSSIPVNIVYDHVTRIASITPQSALEKGKEYILTILGGTDGIQNTMGTTLPESKLYQFTTTYDVAITPPKNIQVVDTDSHLVINWTQPDVYDISTTLSYHTYISTSALDPDVDPGSVVWPRMSDFIAPITGTSIAVSRELAPLNYYAYVKAYHTTIVSPWAYTQFVVVDPLVTPSVGSGSAFEVLETYPENNSSGVNPLSVKILFSENIDSTTITNQNVYIVKSELPNKPLTKLSYLTTFAPSKSIAFTLDAFTPPSNIISMTVNPATWVLDSSYVVIVSDRVKNASGDALLDPFYFTFDSQYKYQFGDINNVRNFLTSIGSTITDEKIMIFMASDSTQGWNLLTHQTGFNATIGPTAEQTLALETYVEYSTIYHLLVDTYMGMTKNLGQTKVLGDLTITHNGTLKDLTDLIDEYKDNIKYWEDELRGHHNRGYAKPNVVKKGENIEAYPSYMTRDTYKDIGQI